MCMALQIVKLRKKLELLEDREGNTGSALSKTRAALEHAQTDVARLERELDAWKVKSEQVGKCASVRGRRR